MTDPLSARQVERWKEDGFLKLESLLAAGGVADLRRWVEEIESTDDEANGLMHHFEETPAGIKGLANAGPERYRGAVQNSLR